MPRPQPLLLLPAVSTTLTPLTTLHCAEPHCPTACALCAVQAGADLVLTSNKDNMYETVCDMVDSLRHAPSHTYPYDGTHACAG